MANEIVDQILFNGGLDSDSDEKLIVNGDYVDAQNVTVVEDGSGGIVVNIKGNEVVYTDAVVKPSVYLCGWAFYDKNESLILFIHSTSGITPSTSYKIIEFNPQTLNSTIIVNSNNLGFLNPSENDYFIKADILGDWLTWTDNVNDPMLINIQTIKDDNPTITYDYLVNIKKPPFIAAIGTYGYDSTIASSNVTGNFYKFKYRYTYGGFRNSVWSASAGVSIATVDMMALKNSAAPKAQNFIYVLFNSGNEDVEFVEIASLASDAGNWSKEIIIDKSNPADVYSTAATPVLQTSLSDNTDYYYKFVNGGAYEVIDTNEILKPYDNIPRSAETCSFIGDNRLVYGGGTYGYDVNDVDVDVTLTPSYNAVETPITPTGIVGFDNVAGDCTGYIKYDLTQLFPSGAKAGDIVVFSFWVLIGGIGGVNGNLFSEFPISFSHDMDSLADTVDYISAKMPPLYNENYVPLPTSTSVDLDGNYIVLSALWTGETGASATTFAESTYSIITDNIYSTFTRNQKKEFGIVYYDDYGRKSPVLLGDGSVISIDDFYETANDGIVDIDFVINHTAPLWAKYYRWAYTKNIQPFVGVYSGSSFVSRYEDGTIEPGVWGLDLSEYVDELNTDLNAVTLGNFTIEIGDVVKRLYDKTATYTDLESNEYSIYDIRTTVYTGTGPTTNTGLFLMIRPEESLVLSGAVDRDDNYHILRIRKPSVVNNQAYYEVGDYGTCNNGVHSPASGTITEGDAWMKWIIVDIGNIIGVVSNINIAYKVESYYPAGNTIDYLSNADRINIIDKTFREEYENIISWSDNYLQDTKINGLNSFYLTAPSGVPVKKDVSQIYGKIKGLEELGNSLIVICEEKVLSGFVGATEYTDAAGNVNVVKSTTPVGYLRPHAEKYGTFLKESIVNNAKYIYFYDLFNGVVIRKSVNGLFPISGKVETPQGGYDYKMRSFFKSLSEDLVESLYNGGSSSIAIYKDVKCYMGYDPYYEQIYITFVDRYDSTNNVSLIFDEASNRWKSKYTAYNEISASITSQYLFTKKNLFHFQEITGRVYQLNSDNVDRCNLYGRESEAYIQFVSHEAPNIIKIFNALWMHSTTQWTVESIEAKANGNYPNGVYSKLLDSELVKEEGIWKSAFPRNMKSRSAVATNYDRLNGDEIRAYVVKIKLTNSDTTKTELMKVDVTSENSK